MKNVQIPVDVFFDLYLYFTGDLRADSYEDYAERIQRIKNALEAKIDAIDRRQTFKDYKTASVGSEQREVARKKYLDKSGINEDWRTETEYLK